MPSQPSAQAWLYDRTLAAEGLIESDTVVGQPQQPGQPALAILDRLTPDVLAVHLEQVERTEDRAGVGSMAADEIEDGQAAVFADDSLAINDAGAKGQHFHRFSGEREPIGKVMAVGSYQANAAASAVRQDPEAVVLDLVNPARSGRRFIGRTRKARFERGKGPIRLQSALKLTHN
jgi:hypothetical protein